MYFLTFLCLFFFFTPTTLQTTSSLLVSIWVDKKCWSCSCFLRLLTTFFVSVFLKHSPVLNGPASNFSNEPMPRTPSVLTSETLEAGKEPATVKPWFGGLSSFPCN